VFEIFGFSLLSARLHAMAWGLVALFSWGGLFHKLTGDRAMAFCHDGRACLRLPIRSQTALAPDGFHGLGLASLAVLLIYGFANHISVGRFSPAQLAVVACVLPIPPRSAGLSLRWRS